MATQTDVKSTVPLTATGPFKDCGTTANLGRCRVKGFYVENGATAGSVIITDGNGGTQLLNIKTSTAANIGVNGYEIPGEGILFETGPYGTVANAASIILFYA